jgi:hypothetical protein
MVEPWDTCRCDCDAVKDSGTEGEVVKDSDAIGAIVALIYICLCIFTFGHAYTHYTCEEKNIDCVGSRWMIASMDAAFAPLYWSIELQEIITR